MPRDGKAKTSTLTQQEPKSPRDMTEAELIAEIRSANRQCGKADSTLPRLDTMTHLELRRLLVEVSCNRGLPQADD